MNRCFAILLLVVAALAAGASSAWAGGETTGSVFYVTSGGSDERLIAERRSVVTVSGEVVVTFEGDPATCGAVGRCDMRGTLTWRPSRRHDLYLADVAKRAGRSVSVGMVSAGFEGVETFSQVRRARAGGGTAVCSDARSVLYGLDAVVRGDQLVFGVDPLGQGPLDSRCGGPLWEDVRFVLPRPRVDIAELRERGGAADLRTEQTFTAGGLRGTVRSTLVASLSRPRLVPRERGRDADDGRVPQLRLRRWRIAAVSGSMRVDVRGADSPGRCEPLDSCGLAGTFTLTPKARLSDAEVFTYLADPPLGGTRFGGGGSWADTGTAVATFTRPDASAPCTDAVSLTGGNLTLDEERGRVTVAFDPWPGVRSRCAGPVLGSGIGEGYATTSVPLSRFQRSRRLTLRLTRGASRSFDGYRVASHPDLTIELVRRR